MIKLYGTLAANGAINESKMADTVCLNANHSQKNQFRVSSRGKTKAQVLCYTHGCWSCVSPVSRSLTGLTSSVAVFISLCYWLLLCRHDHTIHLH